jgi:hypothetical protein
VRLVCRLLKTRRFLRDNPGKVKQLDDSGELLDRDRDIRNLIGSRNLYMAEIYDVGQSGDTQKPVGQVFYAKDKSLIFYGYDLEQQPGIKKAGVFKALGGADAGLFRAA